MVSGSVPSAGIGLRVETREPGVLELLDPDGHGHVEGAGGDRVAGLRSASEPVAHMFSSRVTGLFSSLQRPATG